MIFLQRYGSVTRDEVVISRPNVTFCPLLPEQPQLLMRVLLQLRLEHLPAALVLADELRRRRPIPADAARLAPHPGMEVAGGELSKLR